MSGLAASHDGEARGRASLRGPWFHRGTRRCAPRSFFTLFSPSEGATAKRRWPSTADSGLLLLLDASVAVAAAQDAALAPLQQSCAGDNVDLDWALTSPTCARAPADAGSPSECPPGVKMTVEAPTGSVRPGSETRVGIVLQNTSAKLVTLRFSTRPTAVDVHVNRSGMGWVKMPTGMLGMLHAPSASTPVYISLPPGGRARGSRVVKAEGWKDDPKQPTKFGAGSLAPLDPGQYLLRVALEGGVESCDDSGFPDTPFLVSADDAGH